MTHSDSASLGHLGQSPVHSGERNGGQEGQSTYNPEETEVAAECSDIEDSVEQSLRELQECFQVG